MRVAPNCRGGLAPHRRRVGHDELTGATPRGPRDHREPDRARADDQHLVARADVRTLDRVQADGERFDQRAERVIDVLGQTDRLALVDAHVLGEPAGAAAHADHVGLLAVRGLAGEARQAATAADERECGDVASLAEGRIGVGAAGDDLAAELVPHHQSRRHRGPQLQVGAADAAGRHLQHELTRAGRRIGDLGHLELVVVVQHGCTHGSSLRVPSRRLRRPPPSFVRRRKRRLMRRR